MDQFIDGPLNVSETSCVYDVAVVGLGPVGAAAALLLAQEGLSVIAVEPSLEPYDKPRAIGIDHETMRMLQKLEAADALAPFLGSYLPSEYRSAKGELLRRIVPQPEPHPLSWPPYNTFVQPELERILRASFARYPNLEIVLGSRCVDLSQTDEVAHLTLDAEQREERRAVQARYVIGCDGAWSPVRESLGIKFEDLEFDEPWLVVDVHVNEDAHLPDAIVQYCDPSRPATLVHGPGNLRRWEIMLLPDEVPAEMLEQSVIWGLLAKWVQPDQARIWRAATYRFHALVAERWSQGRVFIAGDAAHQTPPFMAQGLNQGFKDVINLCWKLGQVVRRGASPALLETYDQERRPNARAVIELTKNFGRIICERDFELAAERDRKLLEEMAAGNGVIVRQDLLPPLANGLFFSDANGTKSPGAGESFPQPWVRLNGESSARLDDAMPSRFLMIVSPDWKPSQQDLLAAARTATKFATLGRPGKAGGETIVETDGIIQSWLDRHEAAAVLVRPDHVVFGTTAVDGDPGKMLEQLDLKLATM